MYFFNMLSKRTPVFFLCILITSLGIIGPAAGQDANDWPVEIKKGDRTVLMYQPEPETLAGDYLSARAAVAVIPDDEEEPVFGAAWFEARISTDAAAREVTIEDISVSQVKFPDADETQETALAWFLTENFPKSKVTLSQDKLRAALEMAAKEQAAAEELATAPPHIIFTTRPSVLVTLDGPPELKPVTQSKIMQVVNTPFFICFDPGAGKYFLKGGPSWFSAPDISGPWSLEANVPKEIIDLGTSKETDQPETDVDPNAEVPQIIVVTEPTELIVTEGDPTYTPVSGTSLMYVSNTDSNVFLDTDTQNYFILLAGRWYKGDSLEGPWKYAAADSLPQGFAEIPADSTKADILASVAGTQASQEAVLEAAVPETTVIKRDKDVDLEVVYDGRPRFDPIESTDLKYAANTAYPVIQAHNRYYCCYEAAWYVSSSPNGPWVVATSVPSQIYAIPPSYPVYNVKYVRIYHTTPDVVYVGYLPGYTGSYVYGPTVVYGTGYHYRGWYGRRYYPRQVTWGFHASYSTYTGSWDFGFGFGVSSRWYRPLIPGGGWFAPGFGAGFVTGAITAGIVHHWWGPGGWPRPPLYRPRPRILGQTGYARPRPVPYQSGIYHRPKNRHRNAYPSRLRPAPTPFGQSQIGRKPGQSNIITDRSGNVYRRGQDGWQKRHQGGWKNVNPAQLPGELRPGVKPVSGFKPGHGAKPGTRPGMGIVPSGPGLKPGTKPGYKPGPGVVPPSPGLKPGAKPGTRPDTRPGFKPSPGVVPPGPGLKPGAKPGTKPGPGVVPPGPGLKPGPKPGTKPGPKPGTRPDTRPGFKPSPGVVPPGPGLKPGTKPGYKPDQGVRPRPAPRPQPAPQPRPSVRPQPKPSVRPQPAPRQQPRVQPQPAPRVQPQPAPRVQPRPAPRVQPQPAPRQQPRIQPRPAPRQQPQPAPRVQPRPAPRQQPQPAPRVQPQPAPRRQQGIRSQPGSSPQRRIVAPRQSSRAGQPVSQRARIKQSSRGTSTSQQRMVHQRPQLPGRTFN